MSITSIDALMTFTGRRIWCVRHIVIPDLSYQRGFAETNRSVLTEWHVGPLVRLRQPSLRLRGAPLAESLFEVADRSDAATSNGFFYNVDFSDAKRCLGEARMLALSAYLPDLQRAPATLPPPGRSAIFSSENEAESLRVLIALSGDPAVRQYDRYDHEQTGISREIVPEDLYRRTGRWATRSISRA